MIFYGENETAAVSGNDELNKTAIASSTIQGRKQAFKDTGEPMKKLSLLITSSLLAVLAFMPGDLSAHSNSKKHAVAQDPIVGPWLFNLSLHGNNSFGVILFHADGTFVLHQSLDLAQAILNGPPGLFLTITEGTWHKSSDFQYQAVASTLALARGLQCSPDGSDFPDCLALPAIPFARLKFNIDDLFIYKGNQRAACTIAITNFPPDVLDLADGISGETAAIQLQRLNF